MLSDVITTYYLSKTFYDMKFTSQRSIGFFMRTVKLLLIILFLSTSYSQDGPNSQKAYWLRCQTWHSRHHFTDDDSHSLFGSTKWAVLDTRVLLYQQDPCDYYEWVLYPKNWKTHTNVVCPLKVAMWAFFSHFIPVPLLFFTRLNGREDTKPNDYGLVQISVSRVQFKESSSEPTINGLTVTRPSLIHFQISNSSQDSNVSTVVQEDLEKLTWILK
jgi:hypothetical protein